MINSSEQWDLLSNFTKTRHSGELQFPSFTRWATTVPDYWVNLQLFIASGNHQNSFISASLFLFSFIFLTFYFLHFISSIFPFYKPTSFRRVSRFFKTIYFPDKYHGLSRLFFTLCRLSTFFSFLFFSRIKSRANVVHILISSFFYFPIIPFLYNSNTGLSLELNP